jgi:hypothetical protein
MMPNLGNFVRGGGRMVASSGIGQGGIASALPLGGALPQNCEEVVARLARLDRIAAVRMFATDATQTAITTNEKSLRARDRSFASLILIEGFDEAAVGTAVTSLRALVPDAIDAAAERAALYRLFFVLDRRLIAAS